MLADFQPRCIMIFMAMSSENPVNHPIARRLAQSAISVAYLQQRQVPVAPPQSKKNQRDSGNWPFSTLVHSELLNITVGGPTSLGAGAKGTPWRTRPR
jgi:hypothetical protein